MVPDDYLRAYKVVTIVGRASRANLRRISRDGVYRLPWNEVVFDFYDPSRFVKGYASFDYQMDGYVLKNL